MRATTPMETQSKHVLTEAPCRPSSKQRLGDTVRRWLRSGSGRGNGPDCRSVAFQKPFTEFWKGVQTRDAAWSVASQPLARRLGRARMHAFRHCHASLLMDVGANPTVAKAQMRHSDARITLGIYGHVIGDSQRDAANKVGEIPAPNCAQIERGDGEYLLAGGTLDVGSIPIARSKISLQAEPLPSLLSP